MYYFEFYYFLRFIFILDVLPTFIYVHQVYVRREGQFFQNLSYRRL